MCPDEEVKRITRSPGRLIKKEREELLKLRESQISQRWQKRGFEIYANIGNMDDPKQCSLLWRRKIGGLLRSEFQYLGRENYPRENELFLAYKKIAETMGDRLAVIRHCRPGS